MPARHQVGVIYGRVSATGFEMAVTDGALRRLDYVEVEHEGHRILGQVGQVERRGSLTFEQAQAGAQPVNDPLSADVHVIGYADERGRIQPPRAPFSAGSAVHAADEELVAAVLGLATEDGHAAYLGLVKNSRVRVELNLNVLAQKHVSVLAKTGAGKSYTVGVVLEEFLKAGVPLVVLDPHGEYGSLRHANEDPEERHLMPRFRVKPRAFGAKVHEHAIEMRLCPEAKPLRLEAAGLEGHEIAELLGGRLNGGQMGVLLQAVKDLREDGGGHTLRDVIERVHENRSSAKWNVINALEALDATGVFDVKGTPIADLVRPGQCTIINLKGVAPDVQEVVVTRLAGLLWDARKHDKVPPHILVVEEAHNFCPERGIGAAVSGQVLRTVASEGRKFGMGLVIVSQRPAKVDKNVLSQCSTQIVLQVTNPNDVKAVVASVEGITDVGAQELQRLPVGVALVAGGGLTQPVFVEVRPRHSRHGGRSIAVVGDEVEPEPIQTADVASGPQAETDAEGASKAPPTSTARRPTATAKAGAAREREPGEAGHDEPSDSASAREPPASIHPAFTGPTDARARPPPDAADAQLTRYGADPPLPRAPAAPVDAPSVESAPSEPAAGPVRTFTPDPPADMAPSGPLARPLPPAPTSWNGRDRAAIARVAERLGAIGPGQAPDHAMRVVARLAAAEGADPDRRLVLFREIGEHVCLDEPHCIQCPLHEHCHFHQARVEERKKARSPLRRLWRT